MVTGQMKPEDYQTLWHVVYIAVMIPIVVGNGLIIVSIIKFRRLRSNMHILIGNLALSDGIVGCILIPYSLLTDGHKINSDKFLCFGKLSLFVLSLGSSCYNLMIISIERFASITFPFRSKVHFTPLKLGLMVVFGWFLALLNSVLPFFGWNIYGGNNTECVSDLIWTREYKIFVNWQLIAALLINFVTYTVVMRVAVKKACDRMHVKGGIRHTAKVDKDVHQMLTMVIVFGAFVLCWSPYICASVIVTFHETAYTQYIRRCTLIPGLVNSAVNWLIYGYRNKDFRAAFKSLITCKARDRQSEAFTVQS